MKTPDQHSEEHASAVVFAVLPARSAEGERLTEIKDLLASADIECLAEVVQHREHPFAHTYLGPGKLKDLRAVIERTGATCAVCEDDMSPSQVAALLDAVDVDVLDRTELILTVFARHANSIEGRLQVDLAQLQYELTRVRGKGLVMSRLGAGTDMRGPGETKLEVDRRVIRQRIQQLKRRVDRLARTRRTQRVRRVRATMPLITLAGYTNAGKSTLLNALTDAGVSVRDRLFETLDPTTRVFRFRDRDYVLTDTVGFIRKLPHLLVDAFASTLEETSIADLLLVVVDAGIDAGEITAHLETVATVLAEIGADKVPRLTVYNKIDLLAAGERARLVARDPEALQVSASTGEGIDMLRERIARFFEHQLVAVRLLVPYTEGQVTGRLRGLGADIREESTAEGVIVEARLPRAEADRYRRFAIDGESDEGAVELDEGGAP